MTTDKILDKLSKLKAKPQPVITARQWTALRRYLQREKAMFLAESCRAYRDAATRDKFSTVAVAFHYDRLIRKMSRLAREARTRQRKARR